MSASDDPYSPHTAPQSAIEYVADAALEAAKEAVSDVGREIEHVYVMLRLDNIGGPGPDSTTAVYGRDHEPDARHMLGTILLHARAIAANNDIALDITIDGTVVPRREPDR